jgi:hypothetical protein
MGDSTMVQGLRRAACLLASLLMVGFFSDLAAANVGTVPLMEVSCLRSKVMLKPAEELSGRAQTGEAIPMKQVTICKEERRACFAYGEEVPMSRCTAAH